MVIYPDSCIYSRQHDDQTQPAIESETLVIGIIMEVCKMAGYTIVGSKVVETEILANTDDETREADMKFFKSAAKRSIKLTAAEFRRARVFMAQGLDKGDSLHFAAAESGGVDVLLTVDKDFERVATSKKLSKVRVLNPFKLLQEVTK